MPAFALQSTAALPFGTIVIILLIWSAITIPLTVFGGIAGKNHQVLLHVSTWHVVCRHASSGPPQAARLPYTVRLPQSHDAACISCASLDWQSCMYCKVCHLPSLQGDFAAPVRTNKYPREIPELPWYRTAVPQMLMAGALECLWQANAIHHVLPGS